MALKDGLQGNFCSCENLFDVDLDLGLGTYVDPCPVHGEKGKKAWDSLIKAARRVERLESLLTRAHDELPVRPGSNRLRKEIREALNE